MSIGVGFAPTRPEGQRPGIARRRADLEALQVLDRLDRTLVVGDVARADLAPAEQQDALLGHLFFDVLAEVAFDLADRLVGRGRGERQVDGAELRQELVVEAQTSPRHLDLAGAQLIDLLEAAAQRVAGKQVDLNRILGQPRDLRLEGLHRDRGGVTGGKRAARAPAHLLSGGAARRHHHDASDDQRADALKAPFHLATPSFMARAIAVDSGTR